MDAKKFSLMFSDKSFFDLRKLQYKYSEEDVQEMLEIINTTLSKKINIIDFNSNQLIYLPNISPINLKSVKFLLVPQKFESFGMNAMEEEIYSTFCIENIKSSRNSIRKILKGYAPENDKEARIYGMKKGIDFISNPSNKITEENLHKLYQLVIGDYLEPEDKLLEGHFYRHDAVYIVGGKKEHEGLKADKLNEYMSQLIQFINQDDEINELHKAAMIHFYIAYIHPYFDGNGRTARLVHLWYLVQKGYPSTLYIPFSKYINESKREYYQAYTKIEENEKISHTIDCTPFLAYFTEHVYNKIELNTSNDIIVFDEALKNGNITLKEKELWTFVLSTYGNNDFSTKQLEKDFGQAAYATIRNFVLKFEELGLLDSQKYGNRVRYWIK